MPQCAVVADLGDVTGVCNTADPEKRHIRMEHFDSQPSHLSGCIAPLWDGINRILPIDEGEDLRYESSL